MSPILFIVLLVVMFYVIVLRPQQRARRLRASLEAALSAGDEIVTAGGLFGTVREVAETEVLLEVADGIVLRFDRRAIARIVRDVPADDPQTSLFDSGPDDEAADVPASDR